MREVVHGQIEVLDSLRWGRRHHHELHEWQRPHLSRLWLGGYVRLLAGDYWEITHDGLDLLAARTLH